MTSKSPNIPRLDYGWPLSGQKELCGSRVLQWIISLQMREGETGELQCRDIATQLVRLEPQKTVLTVSESTFRLPCDSYRVYESSHQMQRRLGPVPSVPQIMHVPELSSGTKARAGTPAHAFRAHLSCPTPEKRGEKPSG